jgi:hypothetical protein
MGQGAYAPRSGRRVVACLAVCLSLTANFCTAQDAKADKVPKIVGAIPLAIETGVPIKLTLRGQLLDQITEIKVGSGDLKAEIVSKGKAAVPPNYDAKRTQVHVTGGDSFGSVVADRSDCRGGQCAV